MRDHRDVVITGAGVGGLFLALSLGRRGHSVTVLERRGELGSRGAEFLKPRGLRLLDSAGLREQLQARGALRRTVVRYYHDGELLRHFDFREHTDLGHYLIVPYREIVTVLAEACAELDSVELWFDAAVASAEAEGDTLREVALVDGRRVRASAFVVADAGNSPLASFAGPAAVHPDTRHTLFMATLPQLPTASECNRLYFSSTGWLAYLYPVASTTRLFVGVPTDDDTDIAALTPAELSQRLAPFVTESPDALRLLRVIDDVKLERAPLQSRQALRYHRGNVALLGSSAWSCHPMTGQGMSYTMEDALVLAHLIGKALDDDGELDALLEQRYEARAFEHRALIAYGEDLARSYPDREAYERCFDEHIHGGDTVEVARMARLPVAS